MRRPAQAVVVHGVTGGLLAGLVVALWFLVADTLAGHSFRTPTLLAGVVLNREFTEVGFRLVAVVVGAQMRARGARRVVLARERIRTPRWRRRRRSTARADCDSSREPHM